MREDGGALGTCGGHGILYVPELDRYVHGDFIADLVGTPAEQLLQSMMEFKKAAGQGQGYTDFVNEIRGKCIITLRRKDNELYLFGAFTDKATETDVSEFLANVPEYELQILPENQYGNREIVSKYLPIRQLEW